MAAMTRFLGFLLSILLLIGASSGTASAATTADQLVALARAGLDDDILIDLIQSDGSRFYLTADDILELHRQGLSNRVIRAMQATARLPPRDPATPPAAAAPAIEPAPARADPGLNAPVPPVAPGVVHVTQTVTQHVEVPETRRERVYVPVHLPVFVHRPVETRPEPPVYWGWGGQRRPDSWDDGAKEKTRDK